MPTPNTGETRSAFVSRCVPIVLKEGTAKDNKQAVAVCHSMWDKSKKSKPSSNRTSTVLDTDTPTERILSHLTAQANGAQGRTEYLNGREYYAVPVAGLGGNSVVQGINSLGPEFVPEEVLSRSPSAWNGRYVFPDHPEPVEEGANRPDVIESLSFGQLFNTVYSDGKLRPEMWIDVARAKELGGEQLRVYESCLAGEMVEVSTSAWTAMVASKGVYNGKVYEYKWVHIAPDHLAAGLYGKPGAYSIEDGGGAPRSNAAPTTATTGRNGSEDAMPDDNDHTDGFFKGLLRMAGLVRDRVSSNVTDNALRSALWKVLNATQPAFDGVYEIDVDENWVVFDVWLDGRWTQKRISFTRGDNGSVELVGEAEDVVMSRVWVTANEGGSDTSEGVSSNSGDSNSTTDSTTTNNSTSDDGDSNSDGSSETAQASEPNNRPSSQGQGGEMTAQERDALVTRVLSNTANNMNEKEHGAHLRGLPKAALVALAGAGAAGEGAAEGAAEGAESGTATPTTPAAAPAATSTPTPTPTPATAAPSSNAATPAAAPEGYVLLPADELAQIRSLLSANQQAEATRKTVLASQIGEMTDAYTQEDLNKMSLDSLRQLGKALGVLDGAGNPALMSYMGQKMPRVPGAATIDDAGDAWGLDENAKLKPEAAASTSQAN